MAFNPATYERPYGFDMFDQLHNFFPEFIYDETMFPSPMIAYAQHRMRTLFSPTYTRQQHLYNIYAAGPRRAQFVEWQRQHVRAPVTAPAPVSAPVSAPVTAPASAPLEVPFGNEVVERVSSTTQHTTLFSDIARRVWGPMIINTGGLVRAEAPASIRASTTTDTTTDSEMPPSASQTPSAQRQGPMPRNEYLIVRDIPFTTITSLFNEANYESNLLQLLTSPLEFQFDDPHEGGWSDVDVVPTSLQLNNGSVLLDGASVVPDINCAICQEHQYSGSSITQWRRLYCTHQFHRECIDLWFTRSVVCPVCRADIRDTSASQATPRPATAPLRNQVAGLSGTGWSVAPTSSAHAVSSENTMSSSSSSRGRERSRSPNLGSHQARRGSECLYTAAARAAANEHDGTDGDHEGQGDTDNDM